MPGSQQCPPLFERLRQAGAPLEVYRYVGTHHEFDNPMHDHPRQHPGPGGTMQYDALAEQSAWERTVAFLGKHLKAREEPGRSP